MTLPSRRIVIHDYSGHPFQVQLSRALARRGHVVLHLHSEKFQTPKGPLRRRPDDAPGLAIEGLALPGRFAKHRFFRRRQQEIEFGKIVARRIVAFQPDIVISANAPLDTQRHIQATARASAAHFIFWMQDIYSEAMARILPRKLPLLGRPIAQFYRLMEHRLLCASDHVVAISDDFLPFIGRAGVRAGATTVIENWACLDDLPELPRDNAWARSHMRPGLRAVYSGTLGYKHEAALLLAVANALPGPLYVFSEGPEAEALAIRARDSGLDNLIVQPWVDFVDLPAMLAGADLLVALLGAEAGAYSVPSKILTYLCAGRPILAAMPDANLASRILRAADAGLVSAPDDTAELVRNIGLLAADPALRRRLGAQARRHALDRFDIDMIARSFETIFAALPAAAQDREYDNDQIGLGVWRRRLHRLASGAAAQTGGLLGARRRSAAPRIFGHGGR